MRYFVYAAVSKAYQIAAQTKNDKTQTHTELTNKYNQISVFVSVASKRNVITIVCLLLHRRIEMSSTV